jgi:hypothetical protein
MSSNLSTTPPTKKFQRTVGIAKVVENIPSKGDTMGSIPSTQTTRQSNKRKTYTRFPDHTVLLSAQSFSVNKVSFLLVTLVPQPLILESVLRARIL